MTLVPMGKIKNVFQVQVYMDVTGELYFFEHRYNGYFGWMKEQSK